MDKLVWTGARASDVQRAEKLFDSSVTIFGNNDGILNRAYCVSNNVRLNHNNYSKEASDFILQQQLEILSRNPNIQFMSYNPNYIYGADERIVSQTVCLNDKALMRTLDNKIAFRKWVQEMDISLLEYNVVKGNEVKSVIDTIYGGCDVVVQHPGSSGGEGTFLFGTCCANTARLLPDQEYLVTKYAEKSVAINTHCIIYDDGYMLLTPSVQIIVNVEGTLLYRGADFIEYNNLDMSMDLEFRRQTALICTRLLESGYRGVLGIDAVISGEIVYIQEINNRFQGSTYLLNIALHNAGLPSVQELNYQAFYGGRKPKNADNIEALKVPYSYFVFAADGGNNNEDFEHAKYMYGKMVNESIPETVCFEDDGLSFDVNIEHGAPLFEIVFNVNISSIVDDGGITLRIHPCLEVPSVEWKNKIRNLTDLTVLKTSLINEGIVLTTSVKDFLSSKYGLLKDFSLDLLIKGGHYINCPTSMKLVSLSPFELDSDNNGFVLSYYGKRLIPVEYVHRLAPPRLQTTLGVNLGEMVYFATDRLRLQYTPACVFGGSKPTACRFCETFGISSEFKIQDILEAIDICFKMEPLPFRHILVGGRSDEPEVGRKNIMLICERIRKYSEMPIYLMCLPPERLVDIDDYINTGVTEFGFNIEVFDRTIAGGYMPGKGCIPVDRYLKALAYAAERSGKNGEVRCAFIVGLETLDSLLAGVEAVCRIGAAPILSAFRPIDGTPMQDIIQLSSVELVRAAYAAEEICQQYGMSLGPQCSACQNNTINIL